MTVYIFVSQTGASLGVGSKPAVKASALASGGSTFTSIVEAMATNPHGDMKLRDVMGSLEDVASGVQRALFMVLLQGSGDVNGTMNHISGCVRPPRTYLRMRLVIALFSFSFRLVMSTDEKERNALHKLALAGGNKLGEDLLSVFQGSITEESRRNLQEVSESEVSYMHSINSK
jgi:hypothetical protein